MFQILNWIKAAIDFGVWAAVLAAGVALALAVGVGPWRAAVPRWARSCAVCAGLAVAGFAAGHLHGAYGQDEARRELRELQTKLELSRKLERELRADAAARLIRMEALQGEVAEYQEELENGATVACPSDPTYDDRLRRILEGGGGTPR